MFFILSKTALYLTQPLVIVTILFLLSIVLRRALWKKRFFYTAFALLLFFSNDFIANEAMYAWEVRPVPMNTLKRNYTYGVLLTGVTMGKLPPYDRVYFKRGADRVTHTVQLYKQGWIKKILVSGGNGRLIETDEREADELKKVLLLMGVNESDIVLENESRNTHESSVLVKALLRKMRVRADDCLLITSAFHMRRSRACFVKQGIPMTCFATDVYTHKRNFTPDSFFIPSDEAITLWTKLSKEWTGMLAYKVAGYI